MAENPDLQRGVRYRIDRFTQGITPLRELDAWAMRHPLVDAVAYPVIGLIIGAALAICTGSVTVGIIGGIVSMPLSYWAVKTNLRRRRANGTSPEFGPPARNG